MLLSCASCFFIGSWEDYSAVSSLYCSCIWSVHSCCFSVLLVFSLAHGKISLLSPACVVAVSGVFTLVAFLCFLFFIGSWEDYSAVSSLYCCCIRSVHSCCFSVLLVFSLAPGKITLLSPACIVAVSGVFTVVAFLCFMFFHGLQGRLLCCLQLVL